LAQAPPRGGALPFVFASPWSIPPITFVIDISAALASRSPSVIPLSRVRSSQSKLFDSSAQSIRRGLEINAT
jgi:hypothetical protein